MRKVTSTEASRDRLKADIIRAMRLRRPVTVTYTRANGSEILRTIEPYTLTQNSTGDDYVRAMDRPTADRPEAEVRSFRLDRIKAYTVGGNKSRHLYPVPVSKPKSGVPTKAEVKRAAEYAAADRPTPLTVRSMTVRRRPAQPVVVRHLAHMLLASDPESPAGLAADRAVDRMFPGRNVA